MNIQEIGRVVIIDDKYEEVKDLLKVLSKNKVSVMYFTGAEDELPEEPFSDIRIIFLDIELGTGGQDDKTKISTAVGVINRIIGTYNTSYLIILWTKHEELINGIKDAIKSNPPIIMLDLEKNECKNDEGNFDINKIENKLKEKLRETGIFQLFIIWENLVHKSTGIIVNVFSSFYPRNNDWNNKMSVIFRKLAEAYSGKQLRDGDEIVKDALLTFNDTFLDTLENEIKYYKNIGELAINDSNFNDDIAAQINSRLHLIIEPQVNSVPGNIYEDWKDQVNIDDLFNGGGGIESYSEKDSFLRNLKFILLEVSPYCDYAQNNWKFHRVLHGLMWPKNDFKKIKKKTDYIYTSPIFKVGSEIYKFVFNLRFLTTLSFEELNDKRPVLRIRHDLLVDIQSKISGHINRPGIIYLEKES